MNRRCDRITCLVYGYCFSVAIVAASLVQIARAQETVPPSPPPAYCTGQCPAAEHPICSGVADPVATGLIERATRALTAEFGNGLTFRVTMPLPGSFMHGACGEQTCCEEMLDKIVIGRLPFDHPLEHVTTSLFRFGCPCDAGGECHCASQTTCGTECAAANASACKCCPCGAQTDAVACTNEHGEKTTLIIKHASHAAHASQHAEFDHHDPLKLMQHIAGLMAEKASAQAALEVRKQADEQIGELFEALAEVMADNAALDARLEGLSEQRKLIEKLAELATENSRLKAQVELAAERAEAVRASHALVLENERLKHRLADFEQRHSTEAARTAAKPR
jgi:hypothetical protein